MIKIYVYDTHPDVECNLNLPQFGMTPMDIVQKVYDEVHKSQRECRDLTIRTYCSQPIAYIWEMVGKREVAPENVEIFSKSGNHFLDDNGDFSDGWSFEIFDYWHNLWEPK